jgi:hypothetical protein
MHSYATVTKNLEQCRRERKAAIRLLHRYERITARLLAAYDASEMSNMNEALDALRELQAER